MNAENKITFESFTERVAKRAKVSESEADAYIHQFAKTAGDALENGEDVQLYHFGRFRTTHVDERPGNNPQTGETISVPEHTRVDFQPYKALLLAVNWPFRHLRTKMLAEKKNDPRPGLIIWLLLTLALLALILLAGFGISSWMSKPTANSNNVIAAPVAAPLSTAPKQTTTESTPAASATETNTATSTASETPTKAIATSTTIIVADGDTLWDISQSQWADTTWWPIIYAENRARMTNRNPDLIESGSLLRIPVLAGSAEQPTSADNRQKAMAYRMVADDYERLGHARAAEYRRFVK